MSFAVTAAVAGGTALVSGYMASEASKDAAAAGSKSADKASAQVKEAADQARSEVKRYMPVAQKDLLAGYSGAADIFSSGIPEQQRLLSSGNMNAQNTISQGYDQYKNALMGIPVDQSSWQPQAPQMSAPVENPFKPNMFQDLSTLDSMAQQDALSGLRTNRDFLRAINSNELGLQGVNSNWFNKLARQNPGFNDAMGIYNSTKLSPQQLDAQMQNSGFNIENQNKYRDLIAELNRVGN